MRMNEFTENIVFPSKRSSIWFIITRHLFQSDNRIATFLLLDLCHFEYITTGSWETYSSRSTKYLNGAVQL